MLPGPGGTSKVTEDLPSASCMTIHRHKASAPVTVRLVLPAARPASHRAQQPSHQGTDSRPARHLPQDTPSIHCSYDFLVSNPLLPIPVLCQNPLSHTCPHIKAPLQSTHPRVLPPHHGPKSSTCQPPPSTTNPFPAPASRISPSQRAPSPQSPAVPRSLPAVSPRSSPPAVPPSQFI